MYICSDKNYKMGRELELCRVDFYDYSVCVCVCVMLRYLGTKINVL